MKIIDKLTSYINGPEADGCKGFMLTAATKKWRERIVQACTSSGSTYTSMKPSVTKKTTFFITGTVAQLRECVFILESMEIMDHQEDAEDSD